MITNRFGTSLGTAPTIYLASKHPEVRAVVLEAPFTSVVRTKTNFFLAKYFDMFENFTRIDKISGQVLIFHGEDDRVVPVGMLLLRATFCSLHPPPIIFHNTLLTFFWHRFHCKDMGRNCSVCAKDNTTRIGCQKQDTTIFAKNLGTNSTCKYCMISSTRLFQRRAPVNKCTI